MHTTSKKLCMAVVCLIAMLLCTVVYLPKPVQAIDADKTGERIVIDCKSGDTVLSQMSWKLFKVEGWKDDTYTYTDAFKDCGIKVDIESDADVIQKAAADLQKYAADNAVEPVMTSASDDQGTAQFTDFGEGLFLAVGDAITVENNIYTPAPFLFFARENGTELTAVPKVEIETVPDSLPDSSSAPESSSAPDSTSQPDSSVTDTSSAEETVSSEQDSSIASDESDNSTGLDNDNSKTSTTDSTKMSNSSTGTGTDTAKKENVPQTGQLWWPVPVLSAGGLVFIAMGLRLCRRKEDK